MKTTDRIQKEAMSNTYYSPLQELNSTLDRSHREILLKILRIGQFNNVLEIGCLHGGSTSVFLQALDEGIKFKLDLCDIEITETIKEMVTKCSATHSIEIFKKKSNKVISPKYDLIFIDGDHSKKNVQEELSLLLKYRTETIIAHDTNVTNEWPNGKNDCTGAQHLANTLKNHIEYMCIEDNMKRSGELTERGLFFATSNLKLFQMTFLTNKNWV